MPSAKASRLKRKRAIAHKKAVKGRLAEQDAQLRLGPEQIKGLEAADRERDGQLAKLRKQFGDRIKELNEEWADERRRVWREFDERRDTIWKSGEKAA